MSEESKKGAYLKISNLVKNIGFDERVEDNAYLEKFYEDLKFSGKKHTIIYITFFMKLYILLSTLTMLSSLSF